jgi:hypothetical protein
MAKYGSTLLLEFDIINQKALYSAVVFENVHNLPK